MISTLLLAFASLASAHTAAWAPGMYCRNGTGPTDDNNTNTAVNPLWNLTRQDWWFQHDRGCDSKPPPSGEVLDLPAGGKFTVELAHNRAFTTLSYGGKFATDWPDGGIHPEDWNAAADGTECLSDGALHASNQSTTAGTAFAISYQSELSKVTLENLVVFTTLAHTPWKRLATYEVPAKLPACPPGGCICAWLWVPHMCGQSNMYMQGYKCNVSGATSTVPLAAPKPPVLCKDDSSKCVKGAKQMIATYQLDGNNVPIPPWGVTPMYNTDCGFKSGAQDDIFASDVVVAPAKTTTKIATSAAPSTTKAATTVKVITTSKIITTTVMQTTSVKPVTTAKSTTTVNQSTTTKKATTTVIKTTSTPIKTTLKSSSKTTAKTTTRTRRVRHPHHTHTH